MKLICTQTVRLGKKKNLLELTIGVIFPWATYGHINSCPHHRFPLTTLFAFKIPIRQNPPPITRIRPIFFIFFPILPFPPPSSSFLLLPQLTFFFFIFLLPPPSSFLSQLSIYFRAPSFRGCFLQFSETTGINRISNQNCLNPSSCLRISNSFSCFISYEFIHNYRFL